MAETIQTKRCSKCKQIKQISEFHKSCNTKDGLHKQCKICRRQYQQTEKGKATQRKAGKKYQKTPRGKASQKRYQQNYRQSEKGKAAMRKGVAKYRKTEKGKIVQRSAMKRFKAHHPNYGKAYNAVNHAIEAGKLPRPDTKLCHYCPNPAQQYHHWHGYEKEYWLDVVPACKKCHRKCHRKAS